MAQSRPKFYNWDIVNRSHQPNLVLHAHTDERLNCLAEREEIEGIVTQHPLVLTGISFRPDQIEIQTGSTTQTVRLSLEQPKDGFLISLLKFWTNQADEFFDGLDGEHPVNNFDRCYLYCAFTKPNIIQQLTLQSPESTSIGLNLWLQGFDRRNSTKDGSPQTYVRISLLSIARKFTSLAPTTTKRKQDQLSMSADASVSAFTKLVNKQSKQMDTLEPQQSRSGFEETELRSELLQTPMAKPKPKMIHGPLKIKRVL